MCDFSLSFLSFFILHSFSFPFLLDPRFKFGGFGFGDILLEGKKKEEQWNGKGKERKEEGGDQWGEEEGDELV